MSKIKLLTIAAIILLALNIGTIGFMVYNSPMRHNPRHQGEGPKKLIIEKLHFDKKQQEAYENLIVWHRSTIDSLDQEILQAKNRLYLQLLKTTIDVKAEDSLINEIAEYQKQIEKTHFTHFQDIKKICKPEQLQYYYSLTEELAQLFSKPPRKKHD